MDGRNQAEYGLFVKARHGDLVQRVAPAVRVPVADFSAWVLAHAVEGFAGADYFGTWIEEGEVWIEPTEVYADQALALQVAAERYEIALYDLTRGQEIRLR